MGPLADCANNTDPLKLIREGVSQEQRLSPALDPQYAPVNERDPAHGMVFTQAYSAFLRYYNSLNAPAGDWRPFFSRDVSAQLAIAAVQDIEYYKSTLKAYFEFLNNLQNQSKIQELKNNLGNLFSSIGSLARQLDILKDRLPAEIALKGALQNQINSQLAKVFKRLIAYYKADLLLPAGDRLIADANPKFIILGDTITTFGDVYASGLSKDWITDNAANWNSYKNNIVADASVYGSGATVFERINHVATHNLFTSIFDQFLKAYARVTADAKRDLEKTFTNWDSHEPHFALFLAFLRLFEYARQEANTLTARHLDFYYREVLRLKEKPAEPGRAHLLVELAKHVESHLLEQGELFKAGKDDRGIDAFFANDRDFVANQAKVAALKTVYRHGVEKAKTSQSDDAGRLYASPIANSDDGLGADLTSVDQSWRPFFNKIFIDGELTEIRMPKADIGFGVASHYLMMAEGTRKVTLDITINSAAPGSASDLHSEITCLFTSAKGWVEKTPDVFIVNTTNNLQLKVTLVGEDPAITPYDAKVHGYNFDTNLPLLLVKIKHGDDKYIYHLFQETQITKIELFVDVAGLKTLAVSNDFGPVDTSKPFQPFGAQPVNGSNFIAGSKEVFQKNLQSSSLKLSWQNSPAYYVSKTTNVTSVSPKVNVSYLASGQWGAPTGDFAFTTEEYSLGIGPNVTTVEVADLSENEHYQVAFRHGYLRLVLKGDLGFNQYQIDLVNYLTDKDPKPASHPGAPILGPFAAAVSMNYTAKQVIALNSTGSYTTRKALFLHIAPFGQSEQHPALNSEKKVYLFPQFDFKRNDAKNESEAEFYIGVTGVKPPQNLALLIQVADGTADPLSEKTEIHWSYLRGNEWIAFAQNEVEDQTGEFLNSGIVTFAVPRDASDANTILPSGMHWIRAAVASESDAVCRLRMVAAQALEATFTNKGNDPAFPAKILPAGAISKLDRPDAAVKKITQPFASFGGRGAELPAAFHTRISERLRHKDRAITLWDYERIVLEAFPQIYKVKCLNHTHYDVDGGGNPVYKELAPGHVTLVTIPDLQFQNLRDPLKPYTSLGLLEEIKAFVRKRLSCFVNLHVRNPRFEEVSVKFKVRLRAGFDETFYVNKLQEEITRFLSPWAFPGGGAPSFGGKIYKSVLINFVEERNYVDYVTDFQLFHDVTGTTDLAEVEGSKAVSILVSVPAKKHEITAIDPADEDTFRENCLCEA
jgi:baseplate J-like protein